MQISHTVADRPAEVCCHPGGPANSIRDRMNMKKRILTFALYSPTIYCVRERFPTSICLRSSALVS